LRALASGTAVALAGCPAGLSPEGPDGPGDPTSDDRPEGGPAGSTTGPPGDETTDATASGDAGDTATPTDESDTPEPTPTPTAARAVDALEGAFGASIALAEDTAIVGDAGADAAVVFERSEGSWAGRSPLVRPAQESGTFGSAVALRSDGALIGDPDGPGQSAYVSTRADGSWSTPAAFNPEDAFSGTVDPDGFGAAIAVTDGAALIGSPGGEGFPSGRYGASAYVYERASDGSWIPEATLLPAGSGSGGFGLATATAGTTGLVSAPGIRNLDGTDLNGAVHAFEGVGEADWRQRQTLSTPTTPTATIRPRDARLGDDFGWSIAASGDTLLVGAPDLAAATGGGGNGAAYVFERSGGRWRRATVLLGPQGLPAGDPGGPGDGFGVSVTLSGDRALVSAPGDPATGMDHPGTASLFERAAGSWTEAGRLLAGAGEHVARFDSAPDSDGPRVRPPGGAPRAWFGGTVALAGGTALVQAGVDDPGGGTRVVVDVFAV
jgi:hypothetical protein